MRMDKNQYFQGCITPFICVIFFQIREVLMSNNNPKLPKSGGAKKALDAIKRFRNQQPTKRLVEIISKYGNDVAAAPKASNLNNKELKSNILMDFAKSYILLLAEKMCFLVDICNIYATFVACRTTGVRYVF